MTSDLLLFGKRVALCIIVFLLGFGLVQGQSGVVDTVVEEKVELIAPTIEEEQIDALKEEAKEIVVEENSQDNQPITDNEDTLGDEEERDSVDKKEKEEVEYENNGEIVDFANEIVIEGNPVDQPSIWNFDPIEEEDTVAGSGAKAKPVIVRRNPYQVTFGDGDLPILSTVRSIDVTGGETSYCSMIARLNKQQFYPHGSVIRGLGGPGQISVGNATQLIQNGISRGTLTLVDASNLEAVLDASSAMAVDVYLYKAHKNGVLTMADVTNFHPKDPVFDAYLMQGHRFVMFRADDNKWYALDTIRGTRKTTPQPIAEYIKTPYNQSWGYYIHTDIANGGGVGFSTKNRFDIYPYAASATRSVQGPWSMVSLFDVVSAHQLDLVGSSCSLTVPDDSFFWSAMTQGGEGAYRYEEDRHIWKI